MSGSPCRPLDTQAPHGLRELTARLRSALSGAEGIHLDVSLDRAIPPGRRWAPAPPALGGHLGAGAAFGLVQAARTVAHGPLLY
ncbi:hypothetical protein ACFYO9_18880 [Streptomyces sp. NPDC005863]|uniref:hypothetical protein n=1 Tax=unclassified Streptomyces TaxID=2593676 RepID=UPI0033F79D64